MRYVDKARRDNIPFILVNFTKSGLSLGRNFFLVPMQTEISELVY